MEFKIETQNLQLGSLNQVAAFLVDHQLLNLNRDTAIPIHLDGEKAIPSKVITDLINSDRKETKPAITKVNNTSTIKSNTIETIQEEINQSKLQITQEELEMQQSLQKDMTETELDIRNIELKIRAYSKHFKEYKIINY